MSFNIEKDYCLMMGIMNERSNKILKRFNGIASSQVTDPKLKIILREIADYWNESLRPALTSFCCEACCGEELLGEDAGLMFTLAAAGLSIHDDILDNSIEKRSRKTILGKYGLEKAVLLGDLLLLKAYSLLCTIGNNMTESAKILKTIDESTVKLCEAQLLYIEFKQKFKIELEAYENFLFKVNADLEACAKVGSIIGNGSEYEITALGKFGRSIGFILGLMDDMRDSRDKFSLFHKLKFENVPYPILFAIHSSERLEEIIKSVVKQPYMTTSDFKIINKICKDVNTYNHVKSIVEKTAYNANREINCLKNSNAKKVLKSLPYQLLHQIINPWP